MAAARKKLELIDVGGERDRKCYGVMHVLPSPLTEWEQSAERWPLKEGEQSAGRWPLKESGKAQSAVAVDILAQCVFSSLSGTHCYIPSSGKGATPLYIPTLLGSLIMPLTELPLRA